MDSAGYSPGPGWFYRKTGELQDTLTEREAEIYKFGKEKMSSISYSRNIGHMDKEMLKQYWQKVLEDNCRQEERNQILLRKLGKVEEHMVMLSNKTAALNTLREQYASMMKILSTINAESAQRPTQSRFPISTYAEHLSKNAPNYHEENMGKTPERLNSSSHFIDIDTASKSRFAILVRNVSTQTEQTEPLLCTRCASFIETGRTRSRVTHDQEFRRVQSVSDLMSDLPKPPTPYPRISAYSSMSSLSSQNANLSETFKRPHELGTHRNYSYDSLNFLSPIHSPTIVPRNDMFESHSELVAALQSDVGSLSTSANRHCDNLSDLPGHFREQSAFQSKKHIPREERGFNPLTNERMHENFRDRAGTLNDKNLASTVVLNENRNLTSDDVKKPESHSQSTSDWRKAQYAQKDNTIDEMQKLALNDAIPVHSRIEELQNELSSNVEIPVNPRNDNRLASNDETPVHSRIGNKLASKDEIPVHSTLEVSLNKLASNDEIPVNSTIGNKLASNVEIPIHTTIEVSQKNTEENHSLFANRTQSEKKISQHEVIESKSDQELHESFYSVDSRPPSSIGNVKENQEKDALVAENNSKSEKLPKAPTRNGETLEKVAKHVGEAIINLGIKNSPKHLDEENVQLGNSIEPIALAIVQHEIEDSSSPAKPLEANDTLMKENVANVNFSENRKQSGSDDDEDKEASVHGTEAYQFLLGNVVAKKKTPAAAESSSESSDDIENAFFTSVMANVSAGTASDKQNETGTGVGTSPKKDSRPTTINNRPASEGAKVVTPEDRQRIAKKVMHLGSSSDSDVPVNLPTAKNDSDSDDFFS